MTWRLPDSERHADMVEVEQRVHACEFHEDDEVCVHCLGTEVERLRVKLGKTQELLGATAMERDRKTARATAAEAERDRYREAIDQALGLIETASSRARILAARDVLRAAVECREQSHG